MALSDPQSVTIGTTPGAVSLPRLGSGNGVFGAADGSVNFRVSSQTSKRTRRTIRLDHKKIAPDPITAVNTELSASVYVVVDVPPGGYTVTEQKDLVKALADWLNAGSNANLIKVLGGES